GFTESTLGDVEEENGYVIFKTPPQNIGTVPASGEPLYANIKKGVLLYMQEHTQYKKFRIDALAITLKPQLKIEHLKNI
ncbi:MAG: hypothetical protein MJ230_08025, partial [bacterium]|nr:hypothetical protein [bacterium]